MATNAVAMTIDPAVGPRMQISNALPIGTGVDSLSNSVVTWLDTTTNGLVSQSFSAGSAPIGIPVSVSPTGTDRQR